MRNYTVRNVEDINMSIIQEGNKYYWSNDVFNNKTWKEIPKYLYDALDAYENEKLDKE